MYSTFQHTLDFSFSEVVSHFDRENAMPSKSTYNFEDGDVQPPQKGGRSFKGMESLIPIINKLRDVFGRTGGSSSIIQLPQIVVLGSQVIIIVHV